MTLLWLHLPKRLYVYIEKYNSLWKLLKHIGMVKFTKEFEFIKLDKCGKEAERLHSFLNDISRWSKLVHPICITV